jgi:hypothetical protein
VNRAGFGHTSSTNEGFGVVIVYQKETGFTIVTQKIVLPRDILGVLSDKAEVQGQSLVHDSGSAGRARAAIAVAHLGSQADGTLVKDGSLGTELWNTFDKFMGIGKFVIRAMS